MALNKYNLPEIPTEEMPSWFNDQLFNDCLKPEHPDSENLKTKILSIRRAVPPGENYMSIIYRVKVEVNDGCESKVQSFIIKQLLQNATTNFKDGDIFKKEAIMYTDILPQYVKYYDDIGEKIEFGPKMYKVVENPDKLYIFEDLTGRSFFVQNRHVGLDLAHSKIFYKKMAKFHAASVVHNERHENYDSNFFSFMLLKESGKTLKQMIDGMFPFFLESIKNNEKLCHLYDKIKKWFPDYFDKVIVACTPDLDAFNVLCHGDAWVNNCLFSSDENQNPNDILFIDYQGCFWGSPSYDLLYGFTNSAQPSVKEKEFDNLISIYHSQLVSSLKHLKYSGKIPTLRELHIDLLERGFVSSVWAILLPILTAEGTEESNFNNLIGQDEAGINFKKSLYNSKSYHKNVEALYLYLDKKGLLDL